MNLWKTPEEDDYRKAAQEKAARDRGQATYDTQNISRRAGTSDPKNVAASAGGLGAVDPGNYGTPWISGSDQWYGKVNQLGAQSAANDPGAFWSLYGSDVQGWEPGGDASSFMASIFDPMAMGQAMYGAKDFSSLEETLGGSTSIANALGGNNAMFVDPAGLVGNVMQALASGNPEALKGVNPALAGIITGNTGNPAGQVQSLTEFLSRALGGSMPQDVLRAFLGTISRLGSAWMSDLSHGNLGKIDNTSFARFLTQTLGPTLGL